MKFLFSGFLTRTNGSDGELDEHEKNANCVVAIETSTSSEKSLKIHFHASGNTKKVYVHSDSNQLRFYVFKNSEMFPVPDSSKAFEESPETFVLELEGFFSLARSWTAIPMKSTRALVKKFREVVNS